MSTEKKQEQANNSGIIVTYNGLPVITSAEDENGNPIRRVNVLAFPLMMEVSELRQFHQLEAKLQKANAGSPTFTLDMLYTCLVELHNSGFKNPAKIGAIVFPQNSPDEIHKRFYTSITSQLIVLGILMKAPQLLDTCGSILLGLRVTCENNSTQALWAWQMMCHHFIQYKTPKTMRNRPKNITRQNFDQRVELERTYHLSQILSYGSYAAKLGHNKAYQTLIKNKHNFTNDIVAYDFALTCYRRENYALTKELLIKFTNNRINESAYPCEYLISCLILAKLYYLDQDYDQALYAISAACEISPGDKKLLEFLEKHMEHIRPDDRNILANTLEKNATFKTESLTNVINALRAINMNRLVV